MLIMSEFTKGRDVFFLTLTKSPEGFHPRANSEVGNYRFIQTSIQGKYSTLRYLEWYISWCRRIDLSYYVHFHKPIILGVMINDIFSNCHKSNNPQFFANSMIQILLDWIDMLIKKQVFMLCLKLNNQITLHIEFLYSQLCMKSHSLKYFMHTYDHRNSFSLFLDFSFI